MKILKKNMIVFDGDFLLYYCTMGNKVLDSDNNPVKEDGKFIYTEKTLDEVKSTADEIITNLINRASGDFYVGYIGKSKSFRYEEYPEYKANRKGDKPKWFKELEEYLINHWKFIGLTNGLEADDAVNIVRNKLRGQYNIFIVTTDKDLIKCIPGRYINARDCSIIRTTKEQARTAFWTSMITGDTVDNIKGIPKCGKKYAEKLFSNVDYSTDSTHEKLVYKAYCEKFGSDADVEYTKNLKLLYILDDYEDLEIVINDVVGKEDGEDIGEEYRGCTREGDSFEASW